MADLEEKFLVINRKYLDNTDINNLTDEKRERIFAIDDFLDALNKLRKYLPDNNYYVCNQDEPYAETVISTILKGEDQKTNPVQLSVSDDEPKWEDYLSFNEQATKEHVIGFVSQSFKCVPLPHIKDWKTKASSR